MEAFEQRVRRGNLAQLRVWIAGRLVAATLGSNVVCWEKKADLAVGEP